MFLPEKKPSHLWNVHTGPTRALPNDDKAPHKDWRNWSREELSWEDLRADTIHRCRTWNHLSSLALMEDLRGLPRCEPLLATLLRGHRCDL
jgi:hypothetical protein